MEGTMTTVRTDQENPQLTRSLRSKSKESVEEQEKFDFDSDEYEINSEQKLKFVLRGYPSTREKKTELSSDAKTHAKETKETITKMILTIEPHDIRKEKQEPGENAQMSLDGLPDSLYLQYHKKMLRQENRMVQQDVLESEETADRLTLLYDRLNLPTWPVTLQKITKINDPNNDAEMKLKRSQTKDHIRAMLDKFEKIKRHSSVLQRHKRGNKIDPFEKWPQIFDYIDRSFIRDYDSSTDDEEENLTAEEIRIKRRHEREQKCGGSIYLGLSFKSMEHSSFAIVAEPLRRPYVIKASSEERRLWKSLNLNNKKFRHYKKLPHQTAKKKGKFQIPLDSSFVEAAKRVEIPPDSTLLLPEPENVQTDLNENSAGNTSSTTDIPSKGLSRNETVTSTKSKALGSPPRVRSPLTVDALNSAIEDLLRSQSQPIRMLPPKLVRPKPKKGTRADSRMHSSSNVKELGSENNHDNVVNHGVDLKNITPYTAQKKVELLDPPTGKVTGDSHSATDDTAVRTKDPPGEKSDSLPSQQKAPNVSTVP